MCVNSGDRWLPDVTMAKPLQGMEPSMYRTTRVRPLAPGPERDRLAAELRARYESGASIRTLAKETGRSYGNVHQLLLDAHVTFRASGGAQRIVS
ncbi:helix-turn-helix domain-containing protein [Streptomyces sp. NPDC015127]|uniref:helix-turn-helix domain-containing protein n=1 Tax=Streptomyces sp. NPDC015127 TaxID=3364939 RepID=UPI003701DACC